MGGWGEAGRPWILIDQNRSLIDQLPAVQRLLADSAKRQRAIGRCQPIINIGWCQLDFRKQLAFPHDMHLGYRSIRRPRPQFSADGGKTRGEL